LLFKSILSDISTNLKKLSFGQIIFGGDEWIWALHGALSPGTLYYHIYLNSDYITLILYIWYKPNAYTFNQEKVGSYTCIDPFFTDCNVASILKVNSIDVIDHHTNFSDHIAVFLYLAGDIFKLCVSSSQNVPNFDTPSVKPSSPTVGTLNWDSADTNIYILSCPGSI